jgi:hypothetical protein
MWLRLGKFNIFGSGKATTRQNHGITPALTATTLFEQVALL